MKKFHIFHKYPRWDKPIVIPLRDGRRDGGSLLVQRRTCETCGRVVERLVG